MLKRDSIVMVENMPDIAAIPDIESLEYHGVLNMSPEGKPGENLMPESGSTMSQTLRANRMVLFATLIFIMGVAASASFLALGITGAKREQHDQFARRASELINGIDTSWRAYEAAGLHVFEACRDRTITRTRFRELYEELKATSLKFQVTSFNPNTTDTEREALEAESRAYYAQFYPDINYTGITGLEPDMANPGNLTVQHRSQQPFYFPVHLLEPVDGNVGAIDFDLYSSASRRETIHAALSTWKPALTPRLSLVQETVENSYGVILMHPGIPLSTVPNQTTRDFSSIVIRIPDLLEAATASKGSSESVYIYDCTSESAPPSFLGGVSVFTTTSRETELIFQPEIELEDLRKKKSHSRIIEEEIMIASSEWMIVVTAEGDAYKADTVFIILGGAIILTACTLLAVWVYTTMRRQSKISQIRSAAEAEKALMIVESATRAARAERELNDFIAHEVRNPLAAALSACSFVSSALEDETTPLRDATSRKPILDDVGIIESSLHFINDLLRNMLDMQRASSNQMKIELAPTDILRDVLMPVDAMLYRRDDNFEVLLECPKNLIVMTDRLRLKQIMLNLGRNSAKFVDKGFVKLGAEVVNDEVRLFVEDSGPGVPDEKRDKLFAKFQESLDLLNQGTGIGLCLCKCLADLLGAEIWLDGDYESNVENAPGARFVVSMHLPPLAIDDEGSVAGSTASNPEKSEADQNRVNQSDATQLRTLPKACTVLFVDDDLILRKLFSRTIRKVAPTWVVHEAANGETALHLIEDNSYDLIFVDQYMASIEKQLLGTETTRALRARGVKSRICGLSANDVEKSFFDAGANAFLFKPFPCQKDALEKELLRILFEDKSEAVATIAMPEHRQ